MIEQLEVHVPITRLGEHHQIEQHHRVVLQILGSSPLSVFQTAMGTDLQIRQGNLGPYGDQTAELRSGMEFECQADHWSVLHQKAV